MQVVEQYVPVIFRFLVERAAHEPVTYDQVACHVAATLNRKCIARGMGKPLHVIKGICAENGYPALTVLVVRKSSGLPGDGLFENMGALSNEQRQAKFEAMLEEVRVYDWTAAVARFGA